MKIAGAGSWTTAIHKEKWRGLCLSGWSSLAVYHETEEVENKYNLQAPI